MPEPDAVPTAAAMAVEPVGANAALEPVAVPVENTTADAEPEATPEPDAVPTEAETARP